MWKFQGFTLIQILREIILADFRGSKNAILTILKSVNFDFCENVTFESGKIRKKSTLKAA